MSRRGGRRWWRRKTGDEWFGKTILTTGLVYLPLSPSWQQTKQLHMKGHGWYWKLWLFVKLVSVSIPAVVTGVRGGNLIPPQYTIHSTNIAYTYNSNLKVCSDHIYQEISCFAERSSGSVEKTRICAAEMAVRYAALCACRKVHTWRWPISENRSFSILDVRS